MKIHFIFTLLLGIYLSAPLSPPTKTHVSFNNGDYTLKGTLYMPKGEGPFPAVVFIHGSGPETRKASRYNAKWMASIGYIVLAYDKRGTGESDGVEDDWRHFSFENLAGDAFSAVKFLSKHKEVDKNKIGLFASSQGGWIAPLIAANSSHINFMIIKSASVCTVGEDRIFERSARLKREGFSVSDLKEVLEMQILEPKTTSEDVQEDGFTKLFHQHKGKPWFPRVYGGTDPFSPSLVSYRKWYSTIVNHDPIPYLNKLDIPIFWIFGDHKLDQLGPVKKSIATLETLKENGKPYEIKTYEGEGHNVKERKYELELYNWLKEINSYHSFKFKKH